MNLLEIEEASLRAWPALQQEFYDGWMLRFANGHTKRSNSVNSIHSSTKDLFEKIQYCEQRYQDMNLTPIFRITPFVSPGNLDHHLHERDYRKIDPTLVLTLKLNHLIIQQRSDTELQLMGIHEWFEYFCNFQDENNRKQQTHKEILEAMPPRTSFASLFSSGEVVACGIGVYEGEYVGLFNFITNPCHRRKGFGKDILASIMHLARGQGAMKAYLQVEEKNLSALNLYSKCGFEVAYSYWYRIKA